jgi:protein TonB
VLHREEPRYTPSALRAKVQGTVDVEVVIRPDGTVDRARVTKSLDAETGLDEAALNAAKLWTFHPARLGGHPVAVFGVLQLSFRIH